jgi:5-methylcytosine-specific restriction protein A
MRANSVCTTPGCPTITQGGRCAACTALVRARRPKTARRGYGARWQAVRASYLRAHPLCECADCEAIPAPLRPVAREVDHIDGLGPLGPRGYDWTNLRAMTKACHSRATARAQPGGWNDRG